MDLSSKLKKEKPTLKLAEGVEFEVDNSADTYLLVQDKIKDKDFSIDVMYDMIEMLMGKEALDKIKEMKLTIKDLTSIVIGMSALVNEISYEEMEARFPKSE